MKTTATSSLRLLAKPMLVLLALIFSGHMLMADQIDLGIFKPAVGQIELKIRPDFTILGTEIISEIRYTVRWSDPTLVINSVTPIAPFNINVSGAPELIGGFYYQTFVGLPVFPYGANINPGDEVVVSQFTYTAATDAWIELIDTPYLIANNREFYAEVNGIDKTGVFYNQYPAVPLSNWAIYIGIGLIFALMIVRFRKLV